MVNIGKKDLSTTTAFVNSVSNSYYPEGKIVVENTSFSREGVSGKTLTSRTISDIISGDALFRSPKYSLAFYNKAIGSSLNSLVTSGAETTYANYDSITIQDPESIAYSEGANSTIKPTTLKGGAAYNRILANSLLGTKSGETFVTEALGQIYSSQLTMSNKTMYVDGVPHSTDLETSTDAGAPSAGSRQAAIESLLIPGELGWILERGKILKDAKPALIQGTDVLVNGYNFDLPNNLSGLKYADGSSRFPGLTSDNTSVIDPSIIKAPSQKIYICPSLLECLIYLRSKIHFYGGFGISRINDTGGTVKLSSNSYISNHSFGRAIDILVIGNKFLPGANFDMWNNRGNVSIYRNALKLLLTAINGMPDHLKPDMLVVSAALAGELGIVRGTDPVNAAVFQQYPGCKHIGFHPDSAHDNHIHMSFSAARSGIYTGPGGAFSVNPVRPISSNDQYQTIISAEERRAIVDGGFFNPKFTTNYTGNTSAVLSKQDIFNLLNSTVCGPEAAAFFSVIASREGTVYSINPNLGSGDFSLGMFQVNMVPRGHGRKLFTIFSGSQAIQAEGWKISTKDWQAKGLTSIEAWYNYIKQQYDSAGGNTSTYKARMISEVDNRVWVPIVQAYMIYTVVRSQPAPHPFPPSLKLGVDPFSGGNIFSAWGDYGGGPAPGVIYRIRYSDVAKVYTSSGRSEATLRQWFLNFYSSAGAATQGVVSRSIPLIASWLNGAYYGDVNSRLPTA